MKNKLNTWRMFYLSELFDIKGSKTTSLEELLSEHKKGEYPYRTTQASNNGVAGCFDIYTEKGNIITIDSAVKGISFWESNAFTASDHVEKLIPKFNLNKEIAMFITTILNKELYRFNYGRKRSQKQLLKEKIYLPVCKNGEPDWKYMERYIKSLHNKPLTTKNAKNKIKDLNIAKWKDFKISDLFKVKYGVNLELNALEQTTQEDNDGIAFVSRTEENNGVSAYVKRLEDVEPQKEGTLTVAGGGSVLSTFVQTRPFYSGRDLYLLLEKEPMNIYVKLFIKTVIEQNKYRFAYGRQANKSLPNIVIKLPVKKDGKPNYKYMEEYIKSLPYGDRI